MDDPKAVAFYEMNLNGFRLRMILCIVLGRFAAHVEAATGVWLL